MEEKHFAKYWQESSKNMASAMTQLTDLVKDLRKDMALSKESFGPGSTKHPCGQQVLETTNGKMSPTTSKDPKDPSSSSEGQSDGEQPTRSQRRNRRRKRNKKSKDSTTGTNPNKEKEPSKSQSSGSAPVASASRNPQRSKKQ